MEENSLNIFNFFINKEWLLPLFIIGMTILTHFFINYFYKLFLKKKKKAWISIFLKSSLRPLKVLVWFLGITFFIQILSYQYQKEWFTYLFNLFRDFVLVAIILWCLLRFIKIKEVKYTIKQQDISKKYDKTTIRAICQISRITVILIAILFYLQSRNINISALLAFGGAGGLIIGLAAKDLLSNFFGGFMIYFDRPFSIGDWIRSPDREIEGHVEHIGWRMTRIRTLSKRPIYVPNCIFSKISIENPSRMSNRQIKTRIGIRYEDASKINVIQQDVQELIKHHPEIDTNQTIIVSFDEFAPSSLNFFIYCFTKTINWNEYMMIQQSIYLNIIEVIKKHDAQCAFPTTSIHVPDGVLIKNE